jgi:hypothetical protein
MHYLGLALYAEGPTDYYFLCPLLQRLCEDICAREANQLVEVSAVLQLDHPVTSNEASREIRVRDAAKFAGGAWRILFVHADGSGDPRRKREQLAQPALDLLRQEFAGQGLGVAVIPVRETEAWAMADGDALRLVFGTSLSDTDMGLPRTARALESDADPKATLDTAFSMSQPSGRRRRQGVSPLLNAVGEQASLQRLRELAAFSSMETELKQALQQLQILQ